MILSLDPPFLLLSINKTATTSMDKALDGYFDEAALRQRALAMFVIRRRPLIRRQLHEKSWNRIPWLKHRKAEWIQAHFRHLAPGLAWEEVFKFCFVRHPFDRLQSVYRFHTQKLQRKYPKAVEAGSFNAWLRMGGTGSARQSMRSYVLDHKGHCLVDFIGHYETLAADWETVVQRLGLGSITLPHASGTRTSGTVETSNRFSEDVAVFLDNPTWRGDLEYFGYDI